MGDRSGAAAAAAAAAEAAATRLSAAAALVEELDRKLLVVLRDNRKLIGVLRSFDQFSNIIMQETVERIVVGDLYADISLGTYIVRGENVVLMGQVDPNLEHDMGGLRRVSEAEIKQAQKAEKEAEKMKGSMLKRMDFLDDL
mmetsp:Transcript_12658/g.43964  ORF Transcript_12658/g.43964 Transcript_12658/m.43964 type:complete len:142 (+) Transcript_12658:3-428(+)